MARFLCVFLAAALMTGSVLAEPLETGTPVTLTAPAAVLAERDGTVIFEKNGDSRRPVASITKLMTILLVLEKLEAGDIAMTDRVTASMNAAATSGSEVFLDAHNQYAVEDLLRSTIISSGNDSAVALAEYIGGTEEGFVRLMNARAAEMGLENTQYKNCTGLPAEGQYTTALDVAKLSCAVAAHETYFKYSSVWMGELTHPSGRVTELTNTNRLVRFYGGCDGLKTGSTNEAKYCVSATAERDGMRLIAVVLGVPNSQTRFDEARAMLDYGFASYSRKTVAKEGDLIGRQVRVTLGGEDRVDVALGGSVSMLLKSGQGKNVSLDATLPESVSAPVSKGDLLGEVRVLLDGKIVAAVPAVAAKDVRLPGFLEGFVRILQGWR